MTANEAAILIAGITAVPPTLVALFTLRQSKKNMHELRTVHLQINSRLGELLNETKRSAVVAGYEAGKHLTEEKTKAAQVGGRRRADRRTKHA